MYIPKTIYFFWMSFLHFTVGIKEVSASRTLATLFIILAGTYSIYFTLSPILIFINYFILHKNPMREVLLIFPI